MYFSLPFSSSSSSSSSSYCSSSSSSAMALRPIFGPWLSRFSSFKFLFPCCRLPVPYLEQVYGIPPKPISNRFASLFCPRYPDIRNSFNFFEGFYSSPACPPDKVDIKMKKNVSLGGMILTGEKPK
jgi:hypothetical protein